MAINATPEQQQMLNTFAAYGKTLRELAAAQTGKYVAAGYAGDTTDTNKLYCWCGSGHGFEGSPVVCANATAVLYSTKKEAEQHTHKIFHNGKNERIVLKAMPASEYFWLLHDNVCLTMQMFIKLCNL